MNPDDFTKARAAFVATGELDPELLVLLRRTVTRLVRFGGLPPIYSPTGHWNGEAEREVLGDWLSDRLFGSGQLAALLQQAATPASFMRLGELYLRRHLINRLARSQAGMAARVSPTITATGQPSRKSSRTRPGPPGRRPVRAGRRRQLLAAARGGGNPLRGR